MTTTTLPTIKTIGRTESSFWQIEAILDTREYDTQTMKPIPGTGDEIPCECCGRSILVHAHLVQITNRKVTDRAIVGTQCCKKASLTYDGISPSNSSYWRRTYAKWGK